MAQKYISAGVFTTELDLSFLAQGVAGIGAVLIGRTPKGPAFVPSFVQGLDSFAAIFGDPNPDYQLTYAAKNYLKNSNSLTVVRVLGHDDGTTVTNGYIPNTISTICDDTDGGSQALAVLHHSGALTVNGVAVDANNFVVKVGTLFAATASFLTSSSNYIKKVLNTDPTKFTTYGHYLYQTFSYAKPLASASWGSSETNGYTTSFEKNFAGGSTPWVISQPVGGQSYNLFKFHTLAHGNATNNDIKVMISNVKASPSPLATPYGTFDVVVRRFSDTDQRMSTLESFTGCNLDPNSKNFISRMIGDHVETFDTTQRKFIGEGSHVNKSRYIRVELDSSVNSPAESLPWGHKGYTKQNWSGSYATTPNLPLTTNQLDRTGNVDPNICWGIAFVSGGIEDRMKAYPNSASTAQDPDFVLSNLSSSYVNGRKVWTYVAGLAQAAWHDAVYASSSLYKFNLPMQGGFDGFDDRVENPLYITNSADDTNIGVVSLKRAVETVANPDAFDMNVLAIPGVHNLKVVDKARQVCNDRGDVFYVMDVTGSSVSEVVNGIKSREIDDNYTACYYPDLMLNDKTNNKFVRVSPSVAVVGAIAFSDRVGQVFFAPAGMNRGGLAQFDIVDVVDRLNFQDRNDLYENRINPIATFPNEGIVVFGQKTLQVKASALDRVNVRRLLIFAKKTIASAAKMLLFEPNNSSTWQRFLNTVNPILEKIRQDQGIERFKVVMDTTTNTPDLIDRNVMTGKVFLAPTKAAEVIDLSFIITSTGVAFGE